MATVTPLRCEAVKPSAGPSNNLKDQKKRNLCVMISLPEPKKNCPVDADVDVAGVSQGPLAVLVQDGQTRVDVEGGA